MLLNILERIASTIVPFIIFIVALIVLFSKKPMFDCFTEGIKSGAKISIQLFPTLCAICCAVSMFSACGASKLISNLFCNIPIPEGLASFLVIRTISGAASTAMLSDLFLNLGADSLSGITASVIMATSDTIIYVISIYHSAANIKKSRFTMLAVLLSMLVTTVTTISLCGMIFG